jgi:hypothetical protein
MKTVFEEICDEIRNGPYSILSQSAQDGIITLVNKAMQDAYSRGYDAAEDYFSEAAADSV